jgi:hypothetical protein
MDLRTDPLAVDGVTVQLGWATRHRRSDIEQNREALGGLVELAWSRGHDGDRSRNQFAGQQGGQLGPSNVGFGP